jgi:hypothetical protein
MGKGRSPVPITSININGHALLCPSYRIHTSIQQPEFEFPKLEFGFSELEFGFSKLLIRQLNSTLSIWAVVQLLLVTKLQLGNANRESFQLCHHFTTSGRASGFPRIVRSRKLPRLALPTSIDLIPVTKSVTFLTHSCICAAWFPKIWSNATGRCHHHQPAANP